MSERDLFFLVMIAIAATSLVVIVVQAMRGRKGKNDDRGWWQGPWDEDKRD